MIKILNDSLFSKDEISYNRQTVRGNKKPHNPTLWKRTQIIGGYGLHKNKAGVSEFDETVFETENIVPIGGVQYAMENIFGVKGPLTIPTLNDVMQIGAQGTTILPSGDMPYAYGQRVCLFGVGTGGASENNLTALEDTYEEYTIPDMIPLRFTSDALSETDSIRYYGKKVIDGNTAYYLKRFDNEPVIRHLYKNGEEGEDGSEVDSNYFTSSRDMGVQSFTEVQLTITKRDVREWFTYNGNIEQCRVNSIGLFNAIYDTEKGDYAYIQLFSKLNIPSEPLSLTKDLNILYRTYGA